jgi:hypothetical protein
MVRALPVETTDEIIDYLHRDKVTLSSCSSVSRAWRPRCQFHLLSRIHLSHDRPSQLEVFIALLSHNYSFAPLIRHVSLKARNEGEHVRILDCFAALKAISDLAPAFKSISFHRNSDAGYPFRHLNKCLHLNKLTTLALHSCVFPSANEWVHFLSEFSHLQQLHIADVAFETLPIGTHAPASLPNLRELEIHSCMMALPYLTPPMLYALHFGVDNFSDHLFFRSFMDKVVAKSPSHLKKLSLRSRMRVESCFGTFLYKHYLWVIDLIVP